ncbi:hypothetical protein JCGZ_24934 [Jatropha curcas]|uniref:MATH domain-containing protein n=1 Tax=Jatropha curcas TaxID=180498 RepID=A0A067L8V8_JATCU|nr:hypothetical protein JCGZ_24934 [Jatropha curcas]
MNLVSSNQGVTNGKKLVLYPCGNAKKVGSSYISLYIAIAGANAIPVGSQVDVILKLFIYDQIQDKYLSIQDDRARRFHSLKTENGFDQLISLEMFSDPSNGYLVNDCCAFGAEVHVIKYEGKGEKFSIIREPANGTYTWKIQKFSTFPEGQQFSQEFTVAQHNDFRILELYPKGDSRAKGKFLSLFLHLLTVDNALPRQRVYSEYTLIVKDQVLETHYERIGSAWFISGSSGWGFLQFIPLKDIYDVSKRYLVNDTLIVDAKISLLTAIEALS